MRPGRVHRRLDSRPRARGDGRMRARSGHARAARRLGAAHLGPRRFAAGNVVHPAETADTCGLGGRHVAATVAEHVGSGHGHWPAHVPVSTRAGRCAGWRPTWWRATTGPARESSPAPLRGVPARARIEIEQDGRALWGGRLARLVPGRSAHIQGAGPRRSIPRAGPSAFGWSRGGLDERGQHRSRLALLRMPQHAEREPTDLELDRLDDPVGLAPARRDDALPELVHPLVVMRLHGHALAPRGARRERAGLESDLVLRKRSRFGLVAAVTELVG